VPAEEPGIGLGNGLQPTSCRLQDRQNRGSIDKAEVKRAFKAGIDVPGAELVQSERLVIR
jgi:hypothetical protein